MKTISTKTLLQTAYLSTLMLAILPVGISTPAYGQSNYQYDEKRGVLTLAPVLEKTTPAVVNIMVETTSSYKNNTPTQNELLERFFGREFGNAPPQQNDNQDRAPKTRERTRRGVGSGVIIDAEKGYIITNHHVIDGGDEITVVLSDRRRVKAKLIGSDEATDLALLQIDLKGLTAVMLSDSDVLKIGDYVIAVGNSFGIGQTVTSGIVSALGRSTLSSDKYQDFIQTDAAINQGNSGGALLNSKGELIGINTAILSRSGGSNGIGFAVPANMIKGVIAQLQEYGEVRRGRIGVQIQSITPELQQAMSLPTRDGALVSNVEAKSPAQKSGLKVGDVIVAFDGKEILDADDIRNAVGTVRRGQSGEIAFLRDGRKYSRTIRIENIDDEGKKTNVKAPVEKAKQNIITGVQFGDAPEDTPAKDRKGVWVLSVQRDTKAWNAGLRNGDIIRAVNNKHVSGTRAFNAVIKAKKGKAIALSIERGRGQFFIALRLD